MQGQNPMQQFWANQVGKRRPNMMAQFAEEQAAKKKKQQQTMAALLGLAIAAGQGKGKDGQKKKPAPKPKPKPQGQGNQEKMLPSAFAAAGAAGAGGAGGIMGALSNPGVAAVTAGGLDVVGNLLGGGGGDDGEMQKRQLRQQGQQNLFENWRQVNRELAQRTAETRAILASLGR